MFLRFYYIDTVSQIILLVWGLYAIWLKFTSYLKYVFQDHSADSTVAIKFITETLIPWRTTNEKKKIVEG